MFELNVIEDVVLTYCHGIVISAVLGRNSQNKPYGLSNSCCTRSGAEIDFLFYHGITYRDGWRPDKIIPFINLDKLLFQEI